MNHFGIHTRSELARPTGLSVHSAQADSVGPEQILWPDQTDLECVDHGLDAVA